MKSIILKLTLVASIFGCTTNKVMYTSNDDSMILQQNASGDIIISSLHSAQNVKITSQKYSGDTLLISYKRGVFISSKNILNLTNETKFVKCANRIYKVIKTKEGFQLSNN